jgi:hypothetical protein
MPATPLNLTFRQPVISPHVGDSFQRRGSEEDTVKTLRFRHLESRLILQVFHFCFLFVSNNSSLLVSSVGSVRGTLVVSRLILVFHQVIIAAGGAQNREKERDLFWRFSLCALFWRFKIEHGLFYTLGILLCLFFTQ